MGDYFECPVMVVKRGKRVKCGKKCKSLEDLKKHANKKHGGVGREL